MKIINLFLGLCLILAGCTTAQGKEWRGIVPLHSTVEDVERLVDESFYGRQLAYETEDERIFFDYQTVESQCGTTWGRWNVPNNTILSITVYPKKRIMFAELELNLSRYVRSNTCIPGSYHYTNSEEGISITVDEGVVTGFNYLPSAQDRNMACSGVETQ